MVMPLNVAKMSHTVSTAYIPLKNLAPEGFMFLKEMFDAYHGCIYLIKNKSAILSVIYSCDQS